MRNLWVIEVRDEKGLLKLDCEQPESFFGVGAIHGMTDWAMSRPLFRKLGEKISLQGDNIPNWPKLINPLWTARRKTW